MGKKKVAIIDLSQSETPQLKATGVRGQRLKIKKPTAAAPIQPEVKEPTKPSPKPKPKKAKKTVAKSKTKKRLKHPRSQRYLQAKKLIDKKTSYDLEEAIKLLRQVNTAKFNASVELHCNL